MTNAGRSPGKLGPTSRRMLQQSLMLSGLLVCTAAPAQDASWSVHPGLTDRWNFQVGAFWPKTSTDAYLNSSTRARGTSISFEDDLGLDDRKVTGSFLGSVRLGQNGNWKIEAEYLGLDRDGTRSVTRTISWGDQSYPVGTTLNSSFESNIYRLSGGYSFIKDNQKELGVVVGLHVTDFKASLSAPRLGAQSGDALAPLPTVGVYGAYAFTPRWLLSSRLDYFSLNYNDYDGQLVNFNVGVDYRFTRNFGVGVAYRHIDYDVTVNRTKYNGGVNYKFDGPVLYLVGSF